MSKFMWTEHNEWANPSRASCSSSLCWTSSVLNPDSQLRPDLASEGIWGCFLFCWCILKWNLCKWAFPSVSGWRAMSSSLVFLRSIHSSWTSWRKLQRQWRGELMCGVCTHTHTHTDACLFWQVGIIVIPLKAEDLLSEWRKCLVDVLLSWELRLQQFRPYLSSLPRLPR